ncbi:SET and MYND domain-containing protein 4-like [Vespula squamosa]|uniref:SET and MYND domain-containing protein 4-like n=1 Tax=Vespula squamosa TaxID=30214 RepID=A0ABD2BDR6_VESSQ
MIRSNKSPCTRVYILFEQFEITYLQEDINLSHKFLKFQSTAAASRRTIGELNNGLKALQDTDMLFKTASRHLECGEHKQALGAYLKMLILLDETLSLPIRDYHLCQQGVRLCMLALVDSKKIITNTKSGQSNVIKHIYTKNHRKPTVIELELTPIYLRGDKTSKKNYKKSLKIGEIPDNCEHVVVVGGGGGTWLGGGRMVCR